MLVSMSNGVVGRARRLPDEEPQHVGVARRIAAAGTDADLGGRHRGLRSPGGRRPRSAGQRRWGCTARGRRAVGPSVRRHSPRKLDDRGRWHRQGAVRAPDAAGPDGDGGDGDARATRPRAATRTPRSRPPRRRSRRGRPPRGRRRPSGRCRGRCASATARRSKTASASARTPSSSRRGTEQRADVAPAAVVLGVGDLDVAAGGGEAVALHLLDAQGHRLGRDRVDGLAGRSRAGRRRRAGRPAACHRWRPTEASIQTVMRGPGERPGRRRRPRRSRCRC